MGAPDLMPQGTGKHTHVEPCHIHTCTHVPQTHSRRALPLHPTWAQGPSQQHSPHALGYVAQPPSAVSGPQDVHPHICESWGGPHGAHALVHRHTKRVDARTGFQMTDT